MADVTIDGSIAQNQTARSPRGAVFTTADVGYRVYVDSSAAIVYSKTTDGGANWGAAVTVNSSTTNVACDVWFDQWTPGDSGTLIHIWYFASGDDDVRYRTLDTSGDSLGTERVVFAGATAVAGRGAFVSGTKTRSGYLYCAFDIDAGAERGLHRSTDGGTTWSADLDDTFVEATIDQCTLFPASNTGDNNDMWAVYHDASADALTLKMWDSSAGSASESATILTLVENTTDNIGQYGWSGSVRHSDGHLIVATVSELDTATSDHRVFDINGTGSITEKTAITTNIDDHYYPAVFIDQGTDDIFVAFNGLRDGSETMGTTTKVYYTTSSDGGTNWSSGSTAYMEGAAALIRQVWAPLMGPRFYVSWRAGTTLNGNKVNSVTFGSVSDVVGTDSATVSESIVAVGQPVGTETVTVSESSAVALLTGEATDVFALSESAIAQLVGQDLVAVDTITLSESAVVAVLAEGVDTVTLTDTLTTLAAELAATDSWALTEAVTSLPVIVVAMDAASLTDLASLQSGNDLAVADSFGFTESAVATVVGLVADTLTVTDAAAPEGLAAVVDTFTLSEAASIAGSPFVGQASGVVSLGNRLALTAGAGAGTIVWGDPDVLLGSQVITFGGTYTADLPGDAGDVGTVLSGTAGVV